MSDRLDQLIIKGGNVISMECPVHLTQIQQSLGLYNEIFSENVRLQSSSEPLKLS